MIPYYVLNNYATQCKDVKSGKTGCFLFDVEHWKKTRDFVAVGPIYPSLVEFFRRTPKERIQSIYVEYEGDKP